MTVHFKLDFDDLIAFQKNVINNSHTHHIKEKYFRWITSIVIFLAALIIFKTSFILFAAILVISIIYFTIFPFIYSNLAFSKLKKQLQKGDFSHILGACKMTISEKGIDREIDNATSHFDWKEIGKVSEDSWHYFLYVSDLQGLIIHKVPNHMNESETAKYNDLIKSYIGDLIIK